MKENNHTILNVNKEIEDLYDRGYIETDSLGSKRYIFDAYDVRYLTLLREVRRYRLELGFPDPLVYVISGHCRLVTLEKEVENLQDQIRLKAINIIHQQSRE